MKIFKPSVKLLVLGTFLAVSASTGAATSTSQGCCHPGSKIYYNEAGEQVGYQMVGCGDDNLYGEATNNWRWVNGCVA